MINDNNVRICVVCGKPLFNKMPQAIMCTDCRRKAMANASKRAKKREQEKNILIKAEKTGVKQNIESKKSEQILEDLREELERKSDEVPDKNITTFGISSLFDLLPASNSWVVDWEQKEREEEIKPFKEIVDKKIKEEVEKESENVKEKIRERRNLYFH